MKLEHSPFDPHELSNKRDRKRGGGKYSKSCYYCSESQKRDVEDKRERMKGKKRCSKDAST